MPSLEELRGRLTVKFESMCARTGMYAPDAHGAEALCHEVQSTLAYVDDRESEYFADLGRHRDEDFGPLGPSSIAGWFTAPANTLRAGNAEVVAWFAELAVQFGWLSVPRQSSAGWDQLIAATSALPWIDTWTAGRVTAELPTASLVVDRRVFCYAPPQEGGRWLFADISPELGPPWHRPEAPLRSFRVPGPGFMRDRMVVSQAGREILSGRR